MTLFSAINASWHPLAEGCPPDWASGWGQDRHGVFVEIALGEVIQRLRWIPPGRFLMGSPEGEPGRFDWEGPRHEVTIGQGFWLFDTACTQALWQAVMGDNPSEFKTADRPVENVSWDDVQVFLKEVDKRVPGLGLVLPSEAQWEYACRAQTAIAPGLDAVAWYLENSGGETHPVGGKAANPWTCWATSGNGAPTTGTKTTRGCPRTAAPGWKARLGASVSPAAGPGSMAPAPCGPRVAASATPTGGRAIRASAVPEFIREPGRQERSGRVAPERIPSVHSAEIRINRMIQYASLRPPATRLAVSATQTVSSVRNPG